MSYHHRCLAATLALMVAGVHASAEDNGSTPPPPVVPSGPAPGTSTSGPSPQGGSDSLDLGNGSRFGVNSPRQVVIQGLIDMDGLIQNNYTDGNSNNSDHRGFGLLRAELGAKVTLDEKVTTVITIGYYSELGNSQPPPQVLTYPGDLTPTQNRGQGQAVINDAYVELKQFLDMPQLGVDAGRMPVCWNLRAGKGAFLYDSRAYDAAVTSWDGARATYNYESIDVTPYSYRLPDNSTLYGGAVDWKPERSGSSRTFLTGSVNLERNVVLRPVAADPTPGEGSRLYTYYAGAEFELGDIDIYGEYAAQRGTLNSAVNFDGWGGDIGTEWRTRLANGQQMVLGIQGDYLSGDNNPNDSRDNAFINNWSGTADTYIVESPKYGQLSHYVQGNLEDLKLSAGIAFDQHNRIRLSAIYAYYRMPDPQANSSSGFGQEADLTLTWDYTYNTTFRLFGGIFKPDSGFIQVAPIGPIIASTDPAYLLGLNLSTLF